MVIKKCCVAKCKSKSTRKEDARVTYHKFPKDVSVRNAWVQVTRHSYSDVESNKYVCSRHFLLTDFQHYQGRYVLKSVAVPSVFPWKKMNKLASPTTIEDTGNNRTNLSSRSKVSEPDNLEAIKNNDKKVPAQTYEIENECIASDDSVIGVDENTNDSSIQSNRDETLEIATSVMDLIFNESADKLSKNDSISQSSTNDKCTTSVALSVGSKVEARDYAETWYTAEIVEVDYDEMEVLVRFDNVTKKPEEWISVNSPRLRPVTEEIKSMEMKSGTDDVKSVKVKQTKENNAEVTQHAKEDERIENKTKLTYAVGERCLARWRDNRRFAATIQTDFENGTYGIIFDDGFQWKCSGNRLSKLKSSSKSDSSQDSRACSTPSPTPGAGPSTSGATVPMLPTVFHTHLFDPTRDYLGSKSERREQKRKLNIKEIFNIGQKQRRKEVPVKDKKQKVEKEKKKRTYKKNVKTEVKIEKKDIPDAIASIIGTIKSEGENISTKKPAENDISKKVIKDEKCSAECKESKPLDRKPKSGKIQHEISDIKEKIVDSDAEQLNSTDVGNKLEKESDVNVSDEEFDTFDDNDVNLSSDLDAKHSDDLDGKMGIDKIEEEDKLQNFEKPDDVTHERVMDRIKEAINKLEDGLNRERNAGSPVINTELNPDSPKINIENNVGSPKIESKIDVDSPKVDTELKPDSPEMKAELDGDDSAKVNVEQNPESPKAEAELNADSPNLDLANEEINSPEVEPVKEETEKPIEKIVIKLNSGACRIKKSKKRSRAFMELGQKLKLKHESNPKKRKMNCDANTTEKKEESETNPVIFEKELPESALPEGEWCCKWVNGQPMGTVVEREQDNRSDVMNKLAYPRMTVQVEDKRLPEGWVKLMVRRSLGSSAGKWDVVLLSPDKRRFHTKTDMRNYLENNTDPSLKSYECALLDFSVHLKLARRMGWVSGISGRAGRRLVRPLKRKKLMMKRGDKEKRHVKKRKLNAEGRYKFERGDIPGTSDSSLLESSGNISFNNSVLEDGHVYVGSLKVQVIDNLLRCPAEACLKSVRNTTLLQMHIKNYHRELLKCLGATPKVLDLAYARTMPVVTETRRHEPEHKYIKVKLPKLPKRIEEKYLMKNEHVDLRGNTSSSMPPKRIIPRKIPRSMDSPIMRQLARQSEGTGKGPRVLLPVRRPEPVQPPPELETDDLQDSLDNSQLEPIVPVAKAVVDFQTAISVHTLTKPLETRRRPENRKVFATISKAPLSEDDEDTTGMTSDVETRSSFPGSGTPDSKTMEPSSVVQNIPMSSESNEDPAMYMYTETGERIKLERMKREEIINCHCGFREEDGLMVQCELCLCWQHALCHNIQREADVPQKYTCSICLSPRRGRRSQRFLHDQDRVHEGLLPGARPSRSLRRSHAISGDLLHIADALQALRVKYYVATKKNHPKLYLWAKDWETHESAFSQDKSNAYSDLSIIINNMNSSRGTVRPRNEESARADMQTPTEEQEDRFCQNGPLSNHSLLGGLLSSPGGPSLEMPISTSELERLAKSVQEQADSRPVVTAPQPEAAIENGACRERLLRHVQRCQALIDARLDTLEAEIVELEAQEPSFEDDETADYFPRTKQTVQMLLRDLQTMEQLGRVT